MSGYGYGAMILASLRDDLSVGLSVNYFGVASEIAVYGPYETRDKAEAAAREAVAHVVRGIQAHKCELLASNLEV